MFKREKQILRNVNKVFRVLGQIESHYRILDPRTPEDVNRIAIAAENRLKQLVDEGILSFVPEIEITVTGKQTETDKKSITLPIIRSIKINEMELMMAVMGWKDPKGE